MNNFIYFIMVNMTTIINWRIYCITEGIWTYGYLDDTQGTPTTCFTNTGHTVNGNSQQQVSTISNDITTTKILEEIIPTGGNFRCQGYKFTCPANETSTHTVSWNYPITVMASFFTSKTIWEGCVLDTIVAPNTTVGTLTANINSGVTVLPVSLSVIQNFEIGYELKINSDFIGQVIAIDINALTVTVDTATGTGYTSGYLVKMQVRTIQDFEISEKDDRYIIGRSKVGGKYLPTGIPVHVIFNNTTGSSITFRYEVEYLY